MGWADSERVKQRGVGRRRTWWAAGRLRAARKRPCHARRRMSKLFPRRQRRLQCPSVRVHASGLGGGQRGRERAEAGIERAVGANEGVFKRIKSSESLGVRERRRVRSRGRKHRAMRQTGEGSVGAVRSGFRTSGRANRRQQRPKRQCLISHISTTSTYRSYVFVTEDLALSPSQDACRHSPRISDTFHTVAAPTIHHSSAPVSRISRAADMRMPGRCRTHPCGM
jgi:hypothetical protein